jgi:predicted RNase H-related nuclease YkuK (DUF458 family)
MGWKRYNGSVIEGSIVDATEATLLAEREKGFKTHICIGTDSQVSSGIIEFATVIVFIRERQGGFMFIQKEKSSQEMSLKERMISEVGKSVDIAYKLQPIITKYGIHLEVHADINADPGFKSHSAFNEAMGYIKGMGFVFKAKPDAFASSYCADKVI